MRDILFGFALALGLIALAVVVAQAQSPACTHWSSPGGSATSSQCTEAAPCRIMTFLNSSMVIPGAVLCLKDGTYAGSESMISIPDGFAGTSEKPITIKAVNPGKVTIDGQDSSRPINTKGSWGVIQGVNAIRGDNENVMVRGTNWLIKDLVTWNVGSNGDTNIHMSGTDNTVEDCGSFGAARKSIAAGAAGGNRNTVRRCWARWEANLHMSSNPTNTFEGGYGQDGFTFENTIATWNTQGRVTEPEGLGELFSTKNSKWLGSIFYLKASDSYAPSVLMFGTTDAGSHSQQGHFNPTSNLIFKHILAYIDPQHSKFNSVKAFLFIEGTDPGHPPGTGNTLTDLTSIAGSANSFSSSFPVGRVQAGTSVASAIGAGKSMWLDSYAGPGICKRYEKGQLTTRGLWPFPMNQRIKDALVQAGYQAVDVTQTMEQLFGPIPEQCRTEGEIPIPPGPGPGPAVPVPPSAVTATVQGGGVLVSWTDTVNTVQTGYVVERKVGAGGYDHLAQVPGAEARSYTDGAPVVGSQNCYVVYTRGTAGPSGFSSEACAAVGVPPGPSDSVPLTCEGALEAGGRLTMQCVPQVGRR